jgi:linoleoyl-CoA desaturase
LKDKHIHIASDSELLKTIYREVDPQLLVSRKIFQRKIWLKFLFYFPLTIATYACLFLVKSPLVFTGCFILYGFIAMLFAFNFSHDFSHNTIFRSRKLNHFCFTLIYSMVGAHATAWKQRHINSHHYAPNVEDYDTDLKITKLIRVIPGSEHAWYHRYQHYYAPIAYTGYSLFWVFIKDFVILFSKDDESGKKDLKYHFSFWIQKIFYLGIIIVLPLLFSSQPWWIVLAGFVLMHLFQSLFLLFTFFMTHHVEKTEYPTTDKNGMINSSWLMNQIKSSNDMHPFSETANFILGGFNNHIAHHLFPHVHHIYYPKLNKQLYRILSENGITPNQTSYWGGIVSHLKLLKKMSVA